MPAYRDRASRMRVGGDLNFPCSTALEAVRRWVMGGLAAELKKEHAALIAILGEVKARRKRRGCGGSEAEHFFSRGQMMNQVEQRRRDARWFLASPYACILGGKDAVLRRNYQIVAQDPVVAGTSG